MKRNEVDNDNNELSDEGADVLRSLSTPQRGSFREMAEITTPLRQMNHSTPVRQAAIKRVRNPGAPSKLKNRRVSHGDDTPTKEPAKELFPPLQTGCCLLCNKHGEESLHSLTAEEIHLAETLPRTSDQPHVHDNGLPLGCSSCSKFLLWYLETMASAKPNLNLQGSLEGSREGGSYIRSRLGLDSLLHIVDAPL